VAQGLELCARTWPNTGFCNTDAAADKSSICATLRADPRADPRAALRAAHPPLDINL